MPIVKHPETGEPVREEVNYVAVEKEEFDRRGAELENQATDLRTDVTNLEAQLEEKHTALAQVESAQADLKSDVEQYYAIKPEPQPETPADPASSEGEVVVESASVDIPVSADPIF